MRMSSAFRLYLLIFMALQPFVSLKAQDTIYFHDETFAIARLKKIDLKKIEFLEINEKGDSSLQKEKSERIDSICFSNGSCYRKGKTGKGTLGQDAQALQSYWEGRSLGMKNHEFSGSLMLKSYVSGVLVAGFPYPLYQSLKEPDIKALPTAEATRFLSNKPFADGYRKSVKKGRLHATMSLYFAGLISSFLVLSILKPH